VLVRFGGIGVAERVVLTLYGPPSNQTTCGGVRAAKTSDDQS
jgi:hypothetical protein